MSEAGLGPGGLLGRNYVTFDQALDKWGFLDPQDQPQTGNGPQDVHPRVSGSDSWCSHICAAFLSVHQSGKPVNSKAVKAQLAKAYSVDARRGGIHIKIVDKVLEEIVHLLRQDLPQSAQVAKQKSKSTEAEVQLFLQLPEGLTGPPAVLFNGMTP